MLLFLGTSQSKERQQVQSGKALRWEQQLPSDNPTPSWVRDQLNWPLDLCSNTGSRTRDQKIPALTTVPQFTEQIRCSQERLPQWMVPNICSTWELLQALASCTSLHWSVAASAQQGIWENLNSFWVSQAADPAPSLIPVQHSSAVLASHLLLL